ncbi:MAG TPA: hypothetical protein VMI12_03415 [Puia sp.]|nr:hypothetical protein [Puia sp.]
MYSINKKIVAIFLIAAFAQKLSIGLYLHNWLHENKNSFISDIKYPSIGKYQLKCTCIEDALMPLIASDGIDELTTPKIYLSSSPNFYRSFSFSHAKKFHSLRGPPHRNT